MSNSAYLRTLAVPVPEGSLSVGIPDQPDFDVDRYLVNGCEIVHQDGTKSIPGITREGRKVTFMSREAIPAGSVAHLFMLPRSISETGGSPGTLRTDP